MFWAPCLRIFASVTGSSDWCELQFQISEKHKLPIPKLSNKKMEKLCQCHRAVHKCEMFKSMEEFILFTFIKY